MNCDLDLNAHNFQMLIKIKENTGIYLLLLYSTAPSPPIKARPLYKTRVWKSANIVPAASERNTKGRKCGGKHFPHFDSHVSA